MSRRSATCAEHSEHSFSLIAPLPLNLYEQAVLTVALQDQPSLASLAMAS